MQTSCLFILLVMGEGIISVTVITQPEINATLSSNGSIVLNCTHVIETTERITIASINWMKNIEDEYTDLARFTASGVRLTENGSYLINRSKLISPGNGSTSFVLIIKDIECRDDGKYQCLIWFYGDDGIPVAKKEGTNVFLQVDAERPSNFTLYPNNTLRENDKVILSCSANVGNPEGYIAIWKINMSENVPILLNKSNSIQEKNENCSTISNLTITYTVSRNDNGAVFSCSSQNRQTQSPRRVTDPVNILYGPSDVKIDISPANLKVFIGTNVDLTCNSDGNPVPTFRWIFNSSYDRNDEMRPLTWDGRTLSLRNVKLNDSGDYMCIASNLIYEETLNKSSYITLKVHKREHVTQTCGEKQCAFGERCIVQDYNAVCVTNMWTIIALPFIFLTLIFGMTTVILCIKRTKPKDKTSININGDVKMGDRVQFQSNDYDISAYSDPKDDVTKLCPNTEKDRTDNTAYADPVDTNNQYASVQKTANTSNPPNVYDGAWV